MNVEREFAQQTVTEDISHIVRLDDLAKVGILDDEERAFLATLEQHRVGSAVESEVVADSGVPPEAHSHRLVLSPARRKRTDAILVAHGAQHTS